MKQIEPVYKADILQQLAHFDGTPTAIRNLEGYIEHFRQTISRACDEIVRLRKDNAKLRYLIAKQK